MADNDTRRRLMFAIVDLVSKAAEVQREFFVDDMSLERCGGHLDDIERIVANLREGADRG